MAIPFKSSFPLNLQKDQRSPCLLLHDPEISFRFLVCMILRKGNNCQHKWSCWFFNFNSIVVIKTLLFLTQISQETQLKHLGIPAPAEEDQIPGRVYSEKRDGEHTLPIKNAETNKKNSRSFINWCYFKAFSFDRLNISQLQTGS